MTLEAHINEDGHLEIPQGFREQLHLEPGSVVQVSIEGRGMMVRQMPQLKTPQELEKFDQALEKWQGALQGSLEADGFASVDEYMKAMRSR